MPNVFDNSMVAHVWAQGRQSEGRSHNGNFHFSGQALYSYRQIIALLLPSWKRGESGRIALLNTNSYSVTTSSHMTDARRALPPDVRPFGVSASFLESLYRSQDYRPTDSDVRREMDSLFAEAWQSLDKASRARQNFSYLVQEAGALAAKAQELGALYGVRKVTPVLLRRAIQCEDKAALKPLLEKQFAAERREKAKAEKARREAARRSNLRHERAALRISVETVRDAGATYRGNPRGPMAHIFTADGETTPAWPAFVKWRELRKLESKETLAPSLRDAFKARAAALESQFVPAYASYIRAKARRVVLEQLKGARYPAVYDYRSGHAADRAINPENFARYMARALGSLSIEHRIALIDETALVEPVTFRLASEALTRNFQAAGDSILEAARAGERARREEAEREARERDAAQFEMWKMGMNTRCPAAYRESLDGGVYMRRIGDTLETSQGARVPWSHAVRVFKALKAIRATGKAWTPNGRILRVGHFQVDRIESDGSFKAGCHVFKWPQIEDIARRESVFEVEADESAFSQRQHA